MVTLLAMPFILSENRRSQEERPGAVAAVGAGLGDLAGGRREAPATTAAAPSVASQPATLDIAYLPSDVTNGVATTVPPATAATEPPTVLEGKASFDRWAPGMVATDRPCTVVFPVAAGTVVNVTNLDNGHVTTCMVVGRDALPSGQIVQLDSTVFADLADLAEAPIPVRVDW